MATIDENKFQDDDLLNRAAGGSTPGGANVVAGANTSAHPVNSAAGPGGTGGWTNIQSYLDANKGDTGSAQALSSTVNDQFGKEKSNIDSQSSSFLQDAYSQVNKNSISNDQAKDLITQAGSQYSYTPQQVSSYNDTVNKVKGALYDPYSGPKDYAYGFDTKTQDYGSAVKGDQGGFDNLMNSVYQNAAGKPLSSGQFNLQKQLDVSNENLAKARTNLAGQYDQLGSYRDQVVGDTTKKLGDVENQYRTGQNRLKDFLYGQSSDYQTQIDKAEGDARTAYDKLYRTGQTGQGSIGADRIRQAEIMGGINSAGVGRGGGGASGAGNQASGVRRDRMERGLWGDNLTWDQLQRENREVPRNQQHLAGTGLDNRWLYAPAEQLDARKAMLDNFYKEQDDKYKDTADTEERSWNAIQDFLGTGATKKEQGFKVRG